MLKVVQKNVNLQISWVPVTEDEERDEGINRTFEWRRRKTDEGQIERILCRPVQQTIDCRSTLWDFIRFESPLRKRFSETQTVNLMKVETIVVQFINRSIFKFEFSSLKVVFCSARCLLL